MSDPSGSVISFEEPSRPVVDQFVLNIDGWEGPLDVLLMLARSQKVDLAAISILQLAEQYLQFIAAAHRIRLELAADYLVMAAWLAYLKSRLLLPEEASGDEPTGEDLAAQLAFRLRRLEAMRGRASVLMSRHRVGRDVFLRGMPEGIRVIRKSAYIADLYGLLRAYAALKARGENSDYQVRRRPVFTMEEALRRLERLVGFVPDWTSLRQFLPAGESDPALSRSALASTFAAALEYTRQGKLELHQTETFGPLMIRSRVRAAGQDE
ncbi:ScpA family protein [Emcibacter sp. SYSU 3D8]|uniref:segregation and condensation protein A n=1 Tax=Emcibacter sp. SYSU 3D8 TaxID=3133969 RepID=UPI0031FF2062